MCPASHASARARACPRQRRLRSEPLHVPNQVSLEPLRHSSRPRRADDLVEVAPAHDVLGRRERVGSADESFDPSFRSLPHQPECCLQRPVACLAVGDVRDEKRETRNDRPWHDARSRPADAAWPPSGWPRQGRGCFARTPSDAPLGDRLVAHRRSDPRTRNASGRGERARSTADAACSRPIRECRFATLASVSQVERDTTGRDDDQERRSRLLLLNETGGLRRASRPAADRSVGRSAAARRAAGPETAALLRPRPLATIWSGTMGSR